MLLAKAFTQRKPEFLEESEKEQSAFHYKLSNPPHKNIVSIALLLSLLFPSAFIVRTLLEKSRPSGTFLAGDAGNKTYLLTGKLTI
ncbi:hypothetical protein MUY27_01635 [Mucilaginibacter sp. RS28]|uniref:Uncharacterized protein n=1 Tax=Mucilaginibacter straminoryzae TaxID=2932774 RepID=A0A9X1X077_9SPHI|nr:hypothetical protein [Mucilaginibacter straminoryzae]MCJ8208391.1 hypothetical protein [Mucilaginibacter straminoryzae]